jgi:hypothetical protein
MVFDRRIVNILPALSLVLGFGLALLAGGVHSTFFVLLPVLAFALGYFSPWGLGLVNGLLLFLSYTFATALMWEVRWAFLGIPQYMGAFIAGGFSIPLIGALGSFAGKGIRNISTIIVLVLLVGTVAGCGYLSVPRYRYNYGMNIMCRQNVEVFLPATTASGGIPEKLLNSLKTFSGNNPPDYYGLELVETEYGKMWKLNLYSYLSENPAVIGRSSNWYRNSDEIRTWPGNPPDKMLQLSPKYDSKIVNMTELGNIAWPGFITDTRIVEQFNVPIKVRSDTPVEFQITLYSNVNRISGINFGYTKDEGYTETVDWFKGLTGDNWIMVPAVAKNIVSIRGIGD